MKRALCYRKILANLTVLFCGYKTKANNVFVNSSKTVPFVRVLLQGKVFIVNSEQTLLFWVDFLVVAYVCVLGSEIAISNA